MRNTDIRKVNIISKLGVKLKTFSPNPDDNNKNNNSDCSVRVLCALYKWDWNKAYDILCDKGKVIHLLPDVVTVIEHVLEDHNGESIYDNNDEASSQRTVADILCDDQFKSGRYAIMTDYHIFADIDGTVYDNCNSEEFDTIILDEVLEVWRVKE